MTVHLEDRHEVRLRRRLADIRPWTEKAAEMLSHRFAFALCALPVLSVCVLWPLAGIALLPVVGALILTHRRMRVVLPMRYPAMNPEADPRTHGRGTGILFFGNQDSSSPYERFKEIWAGDDDLRKHMLILGATGSGKSEALKSLFFNALCWSSGFFIADGKADNRLPTDVFTMVRSVGMDDNLLTLNFLLAGKTPEQVRRSRRRRTHKLNPFTSADSDTIIQMGANMLPKVEGEGKNWQEKALNLWRAMVVALCYKRDTQGFDLSVSTLVDYMSLGKIEELYIEGYDEARARGEWSYGYIGIKTYLDSGCPSYKVDKLLAKSGRELPALAPQSFGAGRGGKAATNEQDSMAYEQHAYRTSQLMPVLNLLDKTYGHIFRDKFPEIDMVDVTLNNRIMTMLIPSLEKSAQEAENLGKLAIACLRVMMSRNLGGGVEGTRLELLESKATNSPYPYLVALDELGYYFSDGIAVIFAQARSLGFCMIPAAQDLEKLTEGSRAAEAGAMMANAVTKIFLRIDDPKKTFEFVQGIVGKATAAVWRNFELGGMGWRRRPEVELQDIERISMKELQAMEPGQGLINALGRTTRFRSYYMDSDLRRHSAEDFYLLRFLQVAAPSDQAVDSYSVPYEVEHDPLVMGERLRACLSLETAPAPVHPARSPVIEAVARVAAQLPVHISAEVRAIALFQAARGALASHTAVGATAISAAAVTTTGSDRGLSSARHQVVVGALGQDGPSAGAAATVGPEDAVTTDLESTDGRRQQVFGVTHHAPGQLPESDGLTGWPEGLDLEALLSPNLPFERKAREELRATDDELRGDASDDLALSHAADFAPEPAQQQLRGSQGLFDIITPLTTQADDPGSRGSHQTLAAGTASPSGDAVVNDKDPAVTQTPSPTAIPTVSQAMSPAVSQSAAAHQPRHSERTAVGFVDSTARQLRQIESMLGHPQPAKAIEDLQARVSEQITPRLSPEVQIDDQAIEQMLRELDLIGAGGPGSGAGAADVTDRG